MTRLPTVGGDINAWGTVLNDWLENRLLLAAVNVKDHGAIGNGVTDDSAAIQAAITEAITDSSLLIHGRQLQRTVYFPPGDYACHDIEWGTTGATGPTMSGAEVGQSRLIYNGDGVSGSTIIDHPTTGGSAAYTGLRNLTFLGMDTSSSANPMAESMFRTTSTSGIDWGFTFDRCHFSTCWGDAVYHPNGWVNWHMDRVRWDSIGGYCINIPAATAGMEQRPFTLSKFTYDNSLSGNAATWATNNGKWDGTHWSKGFLYVSGVNAMMHFNDARLEMNRQLVAVSGKRAIFTTDLSSGYALELALENVQALTQFADAAIGVMAKQARTSIYFDSATTFANVAKVFETTNNTPEDDLSRTSHGPGGSASYSQSGQVINGIVVQSQRIESRRGTINPLPTSIFSQYKRGDIVFRRDLTPGSMGVGAVVTAPTSGFASADGGNLSTNAVVTAASATVAITTANNMRLFPVGLNILLVGAGVAGVDLPTRVTGVDADAVTITVADTPSTSVNPATIKNIAPTMRHFGDIADYGTAAPSTGTWNTGEKRWNTTPAAGGVVGWVCTAGGTPGTWKGFGTIAA